MSVQTFYIRMIILFFFFLTDYVPKVILKKTIKKQPMNPKSLEVKKGLLASLLGKSLKWRDTVSQRINKTN